MVTRKKDIDQRFLELITKRKKRILDNKIERKKVLGRFKDKIEKDKIKFKKEVLNDFKKILKSIPMKKEKSFDKNGYTGKTSYERISYLSVGSEFKMNTKDETPDTREEKRHIIYYMGNCYSYKCWLNLYVLSQDELDMVPKPAKIIERKDFNSKEEMLEFARELIINYMSENEIKMFQSRIK